MSARRGVYTVPVPLAERAVVNSLDNAARDPFDFGLRPTLRMTMAVDQSIRQTA